MQDTFSALSSFEAACRQLAAPTEYVRRVLVNLCLHPKDSRVRFSPATDNAPDYMVDEVMDDATGQTATMAIYNGKTHRHLISKKFGGWPSWPTPSFSKQEVSALLGRLRNYEPKGTKRRA